MIRLRSFRSLPRALACWSGFPPGGNAPAARILAFHGTPRHRAAELERQLRYLRRNFRVVALTDIAGRLGARGSDLSRLVALTFDDGLRNNVEIAYPILQRLGLPATFFVCPGAVESRKWLWTYEARQRLRSLCALARAQLADDLGAPQGTEEILEWMKKLDLVSRRCATLALREATSAYAPSAAEHHAFDVAGWQELRALDPALVSIGSHTMTHPVLTRSSADELERELADSRRMIEANIGRPAPLFAYPNGEVNEAVCRSVRTHYRAAVAGATGALLPSSDPFLMPRIAVPQGVLRLALAMHELMRAPAAASRVAVASG